MDDFPFFAKVNHKTLAVLINAIRVAAGHDGGRPKCSLESCLPKNLSRLRIGCRENSGLRENVESVPVDNRARISGSHLVGRPQ